MSLFYEIEVEVFCERKFEVFSFALHFYIVFLVYDLEYWN